ncbi:MAG: MMPL family transporter [Saprospiraceae bacterium]|nr:MMPL family transporter [Saprospiraceae bacterium]
MNVITRRTILLIFSGLILASLYFATQLRFTFYLEQFFPEGDEDLAFFQDFIKEFETDVNFLLVAIEREEGVFERKFLEDFHDLTLKSRDIKYIEESLSLTTVSYPLKTPFGVTSTPAIHIEKPSFYASDKKRILEDERFVNSLISKDGKSLVVSLKTQPTVSVDESKELMPILDSLVQSYNFENYHFLGAANFQKEMAEMQQREIVVSTIISAFLVALVMLWIFRKVPGVLISLTSIGAGLILFFGLLGALGRPLNAMAALYPVLMVIVGTSDVVHIMSKYIDELKKGFSKNDALRVAIKEIGLATLLTSVTTAIGFAALSTSKVIPIKEFGWNAAMGVMVAYITVIFFTTALLSMYDEKKLIKLGKGEAFWGNMMNWAYHFTKKNGKEIAAGGFASVLLCAWGISMITTDYKIETNLPLRKKLTEDFLFFENNYAGFRPVEFAVFTQGDYLASDFEVLQEMDKIEKKISTIPELRSTSSLTSIYKSINRMYKGNKVEAYKIPETKVQFLKYQRAADKIPQASSKVFASRDNKKARIATNMLDVGRDKIAAITDDLDNWIEKNIDSTIVKVKQTGTGLILDKNSEYVRTSLLQGLGGAVLMVSLLMAILFQNWRMLVISLIPNLVPLLLAGALLGFLGIELEAGISIIFAVVFGIAVDDTIHFLSKFKLAKRKGLSTEESLHITFLETGKAICLTTLILFFGFLVLLFSIHPPSVVVGLLISVTLVSALVGDLLLIPILIRWLYPNEDKIAVEDKK